MNDENFIEPVPEENTEIPCVDSTEELLKKYDKKRTQKVDDIFAMQAVICVLLAAVLLVSNLLYPDLCAPVYEKIKEMSSDEHEIMPNLIDVILSRL